MTADDVWILKILLGASAGLFTVLTALFTFLEALGNEEHGPIKTWFGAKWLIIKESRWLRMPETCIGWLLAGKTALARKATGLAGNSWYVVGVGLGLIFLVPLSCYIIWGPLLATATFLTIIFAYYVANRLDRSRLDGRYLLSVRLLSCLSVGGVFLIAFAILKLPTNLAWLGMLTVSPLYAAMVVLPTLVLADWVLNRTGRASYTHQWSAITGVSLGLSFVVTMFALLVGHLARPTAHVPQTMQMLVSNVVCDGLTMLVTLILLSWAVRKHILFRLPIAVLIDVIVAALLACISLYVGLAFTGSALSVSETIYVLLGKSPTGQGAELGPYFWAMHTTFLPTLCYLSVIFVSWIGKAILAPMTWLLGKGHESKSPLKLTATVFGLMAALLWSATYASGVSEEFLRNKEKGMVTESSGQCILRGGSGDPPRGVQIGETC